MNGLLKDADPTLNIRLYGGEDISVPAAGKVYIVGNVKKPGIYAIQRYRNNQFLTALAQSEGQLAFTSKRAFVYRREAGKSERLEIPVELSKIIDRKGLDFQLQANDILYIPENKNRKLTTRLLNRLSGLGTATGTGILVWHY